MDGLMQAWDKMHRAQVQPHGGVPEGGRPQAGKSLLLRLAGSHGLRRTPGLSLNGWGSKRAVGWLATTRTDGRRCFHPSEIRWTRALD
jgi:hypothetical protein